MIVALVVASGDHDEPIDSQRFLGRVGVAARVHERINLPGDTVQITLQGLRRIVVDEIEQTEPYPDRARSAPARETPADPAELDDLVDARRRRRRRRSPSWSIAFRTKCRRSSR